MEGNKTRTNILQVIFESSAIPEEFCQCFVALRKCGFGRAESIMLAFGDCMVAFDSPEVEELMKSILGDEERINDSRDSLDIQIYKLDLDLSVYLLKNALNRLLL